MIDSDHHIRNENRMCAVIRAGVVVQQCRIDYAELVELLVSAVHDELMTHASS